MVSGKSQRSCIHWIHFTECVQPVQAQPGKKSHHVVEARVSEGVRIREARVIIQHNRHAAHARTPGCVRSYSGSSKRTAATAHTRARQRSQLTGRCGSYEAGTTPRAVPVPSAQVLGNGQSQHAALVPPRRGGRLRVAERHVHARVVMPPHHKLVPAAFTCNVLVSAAVPGRRVAESHMADCHKQYDTPPGMLTMPEKCRLPPAGGTDALRPANVAAWPELCWRPGLALAVSALRTVIVVYCCSFKCFAPCQDGACMKRRIRKIRVAQGRPAQACRRRPRQQARVVEITAAARQADRHPQQYVHLAIRSLHRVACECWPQQ